MAAGLVIRHREGSRALLRAMANEPPRAGRFRGGALCFLRAVAMGVGGPFGREGDISPAGCSGGFAASVRAIRDGPGK